MLITNYVKAAVAIVSLSSAFVFAGEKVEQSLDAASDSLVQIEHTNGKAKIVGWDNAQVSVSGELGDDTDEFIFERNGKSVEVRVEVKSSKRWNLWNNDSIDGDDLVIYVPQGSRVEYSSTNADVEIENVQGSNDIEVVNGDINISNVSGRTNLESVNGSISAQGVRGEVSVETVNGNIELEQIEGSAIEAGSVNGDVSVTSSAEEVNAETVNGELQFALGAVSFVDAQSVNGSIDLSMSLKSGAVVKASSVGGRVELNLPADVAAKFDIESHAGGSIRNNLSKDKVQEAEYGPREWLSFTTGSPDATVDITTVNGSIVLSSR
jgi:DUF4097 and DUF4098 domain-containing protein YvlB